MNSVLYILLLAVTVYLSFSVFYLLVFSIAGRRSSNSPTSQFSAQHRFAVFVPAYKEDAVILSSAESLISQDYPGSLFEVVIIADGLQPTTLAELDRLPVTVVTVEFESSTKAKALNEALRRLPEAAYDIAVVMDADNRVAPDFLSDLNRAFTPETQVVQAHRTAKNLNTTLAILDGISEEINNHIFRKGHRALGLSAALVGSGMAFRYDLFRTFMNQCKAVGGFDKELELDLTAAGVTIEYLEHVDVWDEKVDRPQRFVGQRRRWIAAQAHYALRGVRQLLQRPLRSWQPDHVDKTLQMFLPPRAVLVAILPLTAAVIAFWSSGFALWYVLLTGILSVSLALAIPASFGRDRIVQALIGLPGAILLMLHAILRSFGANRRFIHTGHDAQTAVNKSVTS